MDPVHRARRQRLPLSAAPPQEIGVEVIDVHGGQLGDGMVAEMRYQVAAQQAAGLTNGRGRPAGRRRGEPSFQQLGDRAGVDPGSLCFLDQGAELLVGVAAAAVHGAGGPAFLTGVGVAAQVDP